MSDELTPGVSAILQTIANGDEPDGRSWRSLEAAKRRGLIDQHNKLTSAGRAALGLVKPFELVEPPASTEFEWMDRHHRTRVEREDAEKLARKAG